MKDALLQIDFWDVGQGDCSVLRLPSGELIIIDVGPIGSPLVDWLEARRTPPVIKSIVLTHNDSDHAGALASIVKQPATQIQSIRMLVDRDVNSLRFQKIFRPALEASRRNLFPIDRLELGTVLWSDPSTGTELRVVHPSFVDNLEATNPNDTSAVIVLNSNGRAMVAWPGDLDVRRTAEVFAQTQLNLLVGPHHGGPSDYPTKAMRNRDPEGMASRRSDIRRAMTSMNPRRSFLSVGTNNSFQHPRPGYLRLLARQGAKITCSQLTRCCAGLRAKSGRAVFPGAGALGLRPARTGTPCRGAVRYFLKDGQLWPDQFESEHRSRITKLLRAQCLRG